MGNYVYVVHDGNDSFPVQVFKTWDAAQEWVKVQNLIYYGELTVYKVEFNER